MQRVRFISQLGGCRGLYLLSAMAASLLGQVWLSCDASRCNRAGPAALLLNVVSVT